MHLGKRLRQERLRRHLSQEALAEALNISPRSVRRWEQGQALPQASIRLHLSRFFEIPLEELLAEDEEQTFPSYYWSVPYPRNPFFTGRDAFLHQMHHLLFPAQNTDDTYSIALSGLGGIGKTQTATEYAYQHAKEYTSIFLLHAETYEHMRSDLITLADRLDLPEREEQDQNRIVNAVHRWLTSHRGWLLIVDNVQEIEAVKRLLPVACCGSLLFTTRLPTLGTLAKILHLEQMTKEEGISFLLRRTGHTHRSSPALSRESPALASDRAAADQLFALMDGLPLALDQAAAYIEKTQSNLSNFLHLFQGYPMRLLQIRETYDEHPVSVATTFLLAFDLLQQTNPTAADLLTLYCMLPLDGIPEELVTEANTYLGPLLSVLGADALLYQQALQDVLSYSFVRRLPETHSIVIHRLVQLVIREQLEREVQQQWAVRLLRAANAIFPQWKYTVLPDTSTDWPRSQRLLSLVFACRQLIEDYQVYIPEALHLLARAAQYSRERGQYHQAEVLCHQAMKLNEVVHKSDHVETAMILCVQMTIHYDLGRYQEAEVCGQRALALYEQFLGPEHAVTIEAANFLGALSRLCGHYQEAEALFLRALAFFEQYGKGAEMASPLFSLANLYLMQKQFEKAEPLFLRALRLREDELGPEHVDTGTSLNGLARLYTECGRYEEASSFYQRALTTYERVLGPDHPYVAVVLLRFGQLSFVQQRYHEAEVLYQRCFTVQERVYPREHIHCIELWLQWGQLTLAQKRYSEAKERLQRAWSLALRGLSPEHELIADIRAELGRLDTLQNSSHEL